MTFCRVCSSFCVPKNLVVLNFCGGKSRSDGSASGNDARRGVSLKLECTVHYKDCGNYGFVFTNVSSTHAKICHADAMKPHSSLDTYIGGSYKES